MREINYKYTLNILNGSRETDTLCPYKQSKKEITSTCFKIKELKYREVIFNVGGYNCDLCEYNEPISIVEHFMNPNKRFFVRCKADEAFEPDKNYSILLTEKICNERIKL